MFGDDQKIKDLREKWESMSHDEKVDKFLWKMVWFHHTKHIPGSPSQAIEHLTTELKNSSNSSDKLTKSIRNATWVASIIAVFGLIVAILNLYPGKVDNTSKAIPEPQTTITEQYKSIDDFRLSVIEPRCPYYDPDGITYKRCLSSFIDELLAKRKLNEKSETYKNFFPFCRDYALTQGEVGFGANTVAFSACLIFKLSN